MMNKCRFVVRQFQIVHNFTAADADDAINFRLLYST